MATAKLQHVLHTEIIAALKSCGVKDRGQKAANLHMCRESRMPAILTENLFIDVANDANKLKRADVLEAIVDGHVTGIAKYLDLSKKATAHTIKKTTSSTQDQNITVIVNGKQVDEVKLIDQVTYVPLRTVCEALGAKVSWDNATKTATVTY